VTSLENAFPLLSFPLAFRVTQITKDAWRFKNSRPHMHNNIAPTLGRNYYLTVS
jgi:hypothetical protein